MRKLIPALGLAVLTGACGGASTPAGPTTFAPPTIVESFSATLPILGSNTHSFSVTAPGGLKVTLTSMTPSAPVSLSIGVPSGPTCLAITTVTATAGSQLSGTATKAEIYCVAVTDSGHLTGTAAYTVTVNHS
jgi:hypothetical protein